MTTRLRSNLICLTLSLFLLALTAGCLSRRSPEVNYYGLLTLEQLTDGTAAIATVADMALGIGPIGIPDPLKRSQIVTRERDNRYRYDDFQRWAGLLESEIASVLGDNLGQLLGVDKVATYPWQPHFQPSHRVVVDIVQFDADLAGEAVLSARWAVTDGTGKRRLAGSRSVYRQALARPDYAALVQAESALLAALSREIAAAIAQSVQ